MMTEKEIIIAVSKTLSITTEVATVSSEEEKTQEVDHLHKLEIEDLLEEITMIGTTRPGIHQEVELHLVLTSVMAAPTPGTTTDPVSYWRRSPYLYELIPEFIQLSDDLYLKTKILPIFYNLDLLAIKSTNESKMSASNM